MISNKNGTYILIGLAALAGLMYWKKDAVVSAGGDTIGAIVDMTQPRGIRNNNPGNIRHGQKWQGLAPQQPDKSFATFTSPEYGIRAIAKVITSYDTKYGIRTVRGIINRWAPPNENDTDAYVNAVADSLGVDPDEDIAVENHMAELVAAIVKHENGQQPYSTAQIETGVSMA